MEKELQKLKEYIENIEQLGADSRYSLDFDCYGALDMQLYSIAYWAEKARKIAQKLQQEEENEKET